MHKGLGEQQKSRSLGTVIQSVLQSVQTIRCLCGENLHTVETAGKILDTMIGYFIQPNENLCCGTHLNTSDEYPQYMFLWRLMD